MKNLSGDHITMAIIRATPTRGSCFITTLISGPNKSGASESQWPTPDRTVCDEYPTPNKALIPGYPSPTVNQPVV